MDDKKWQYKAPEESQTNRQAVKIVPTFYSPCNALVGFMGYDTALGRAAVEGPHQPPSWSRDRGGYCLRRYSTVFLEESLLVEVPEPSPCASYPLRCGFEGTGWLFHPGADLKRVLRPRRATSRCSKFAN